jgi:hypothetical protein
MMKKLLVFTLMPLLLMASSCNKLTELAVFSFSINSSFKVPANIPPNLPYNLPAVPLPFNAEEVFSKNNTEDNLVKEINLESFILTITDPVMADFEFIKNIEISFLKDGLGEKLVAWKYDVAADAGQVLALDVTPDPLKEYLISDGLSIKVKLITDQANPVELSIANEIRLRVKADVFNK